MRLFFFLGVPKSIYEIEGAKDVAIEVNSFSKYAGFTGVRLGWTVVPSNLKFADGTPGMHCIMQLITHSHLNLITNFLTMYSSYCNIST